MKYFFIISLFFVTACGEEKKVAAKSGYDYYLEVCQYDGEMPDSCKCRAEILKKYLNDNKILAFAKATSLISEGNKEESEAIIEKNPELVTALAKLSEESKICDTGSLE